VQPTLPTNLAVHHVTLSICCLAPHAMPRSHIVQLKIRQHVQLATLDITIHPPIVCQTYWIASLMSQ